MKHWNLKRVLSLLLVVCMVTGLLSGVSRHGGGSDRELS